MLKSNTTIKRINATIINADSYKGEDIISLYADTINDASVCPGEKIVDGVRVIPPTTILTAMVSPNALPNPRKTAEMILGAEARKITFFTVSHFVAPTDKDASFNAMGTALNDSTHREMMIGKTITAKIIAAVNIHKPVLLTPNQGAI